MKSLDYIVAHSVRTLPDSLTERSIMIGHLLAILPLKHAARGKLTEMFVGLAQQSFLQLELPNLLSGEANKKNQP